MSVMSDGRTTWTADGVRYVARMLAGDLVELRASDEATLPRQSFDLLSWMKEQPERNLDELLMDFRERAEREIQRDVMENTSGFYPE